MDFACSSDSKASHLIVPVITHKASPYTKDLTSTSEPSRRRISSIHETFSPNKAPDEPTNTKPSLESRDSRGGNQEAHISNPSYEETKVISNVSWHASLLPNADLECADSISTIRKTISGLRPSTESSVASTASCSRQSSSDENTASTSKDDKTARADGPRYGTFKVTNIPIATSMMTFSSSSSSSDDELVYGSKWKLAKVMTDEHKIIGVPQRGCRKRTHGALTRSAFQGEYNDVHTKSRMTSRPRTYGAFSESVLRRGTSRGMDNFEYERSDDEVGEVFRVRQSARVRTRGTWSGSALGRGTSSVIDDVEYEQSDDEVDEIDGAKPTRQSVRVRSRGAWSGSAFSRAQPPAASNQLDDTMSIGSESYAEDHVENSTSATNNSDNYETDRVSEATEDDVEDPVDESISISSSRVSSVTDRASKDEDIMPQQIDGFPKYIDFKRDDNPIVFKDDRLDMSTSDEDEVQPPPRFEGYRLFSPAIGRHERLTRPITEQELKELEDKHFSLVASEARQRHLHHKIATMDKAIEEKRKIWENSEIYNLWARRDGKRKRSSAASDKSTR